MMNVVEARVDTTFRDVGLRVEVSIPTENLIALVEAKLRDGFHEAELNTSEASVIDEKWTEVRHFLLRHARHL